MNRYIYSKWDGTEPFALDKDQLMDALGRQLMSYGDLSYALWKMQRDGLDSGGHRLPSLQEMLQRLKQRREGQLDKYNLSSIMDNVKEHLDRIIKTERAGIQKRLEEGRSQAKADAVGVPQEMQQKLSKLVEDMAARNTKKLDSLPSDAGGRLKELSKYDFMDNDARKQFEELMDMLKRQAMQSYARELTQNVRDMDPRAIQDVRRMLEALNRTLEQRMKGMEPDFNKFMEEFGEYFGPDRPRDLDELMDRLQKQMAQARSLMDSMSPEQREEMEKLLESMLDEKTQRELARLASNLDQLCPMDSLRKQYLFSGQDSLSYEQALKLMETLQKMDQLETQLRESQYSRSLEDVDKELARELLGEKSAEQLDALTNITKVLEDAGYIRRKDDKYELTPRGMRKIGQKALGNIFAQLRKDRTGQHIMDKRGGGLDRLDDTKQYEFGDPMWLDLEKTLMNALYRESQEPPVKLEVEDFEVFKTDQLLRSSTVLMLDLSLSMPMRGNFEPAKQVAIALDGLIRSQYPSDTLHIIGFSSYARVLKKEDLYYIAWDQFDPYTNMQHGFMIARKLLDRQRSTNKQIILVSDGEPTAHIDRGEIHFQYPPSPRTLQLTLREVKNCTRKGIVINTFMLERGPFLTAFVVQMAKMNKGRVFFTSSDKLGQYLLVDYISSKKRVVR